MSASRLVQWHRHRRWQRPLGTLFQVLFLLIAVMLGVTTQASTVNDCHSVRYAYLAKGLDLKDVPRQPRQGSQLEICPRGLTCCTEEMERKLRSVSKDQYGKALGSAADSMQRFFNNRANKFNDVFPELLSASKLNFHRLFRKTYGIIYIKNSDVFTDFFKDLEDYYEKGDLDLEVALNHFFTALYQRMFTVFNAQYKFDSRYLTCVSQTMRTLQPFGDVPEKLSQQLRQSFVATRTFNQALSGGKKILNRIVKIQPKDRCVIALTKMSSCPACEGYPEIRPCGDYCADVMRGCLANHVEFGDTWDKYLDNLRELADRMKGPFDIEEVVDPIGVKISDAIMNFQRSGYEVSERVKQECGTPRIQKREAGSSEVYDLTRLRRSPKKGGRGRGGQNKRRRGEQKVSKLKTLIGDIKESVPAFKGFWARLPRTMCSKNGGGGSQPRDGKSANDDKCWNGRGVEGNGGSGKYRPSDVHTRAGGGYNPGVQDQIQALKSINKKLTKAIKGQRVEWGRSQSNGRGPGYRDHSIDRDYGGSDEYEGSGGSDNEGCDHSDDEDCYNTGGSGDGGASAADGSGDGQSDVNEDVMKGGKGQEYDPYHPPLPTPAPPVENSLDNSSQKEDEVEEQDSDDEYDDNWPPWVTSPTEDDDVKVVDPNDIYGHRGEPRKTSGAAAPTSRSTLTVLSAVAYVILPAITCALGSLLAV